VSDELRQASFADLAIDASRPDEHAVPKNGAIVRCPACDAQIVWTVGPLGRPVALSMASVRTHRGLFYAQDHDHDCPTPRARRRREGERGSP
jgi:hypothetical protein